MSYLDNYQTGMVDNSNDILVRLSKLRDEELAARLTFKDYLNKFKEKIEYYIFTFFLKCDKQTDPRLHDIYKKDNLWIVWFTDGSHRDEEEEFFLEISEQDLILAINTEVPKWI